MTATVRYNRKTLPNSPTFLTTFSEFSDFSTKQEGILLIFLRGVKSNSGRLIRAASPSAPRAGLNLCRFMVRFPPIWVFRHLVSEVCMARKAAKKSVSCCEYENRGNQRNKDSAKLPDVGLETYKARLLALRARIRGDVSTMTEGALSQSRTEAAGDLSAMPMHMADIGTDNFEQEQTLAFIQSDNATLGLIEEALARIKNGSYGICESCGKTIPKARLNVLPYTPDCVQCVELAHQDK